MPDPVQLLVVDDDPGVRELLHRYFTGQGFVVTEAGDGAGLRAAIANRHIDLVLLDLGLPGEDGLELTRELRRGWSGALIIITGRGEAVDRVVGLELGADDYVTKPFDLRELLARVRSVLRRSHAARTANAGTRQTLRFGTFRADLAARTLERAGGGAIELTTGEFALLRVFLEHPQRVLSRDELMDQLHGRAPGPFDRAIDVQVGRLRRKLEADPTRPELIKSVRGAGYLFAAAITHDA